MQYALNVDRLVRRVRVVVGGDVTCDLAAVRGHARVDAPFALVLRRGAATYRVEVGGDRKPFAVGDGLGTGRFAAAEREIRRIVGEVAGDAKAVPAEQPAGHESRVPAA
ncbi:MAG: hypothetical protein JWO31_1510 [Phycisphaerales bacterium]|nr:hypothetical protein [Phycisphaerales bacterium]